jgi:hypothetical protein
MERTFSTRLTVGALALAVSFAVASFAPTGLALAQGAAPPKLAASPAAPNKSVQLLLLRSTLLALDHANQTGNYTVLRDLAGPNFRKINNASKLGQIFANIVAQKIELAPIAIVEPQFAAALDANRRLRIKGALPRPKVVVLFDLLYEQDEGRWKLFGISIGSQPVATPAAP